MKFYLYDPHPLQDELEDLFSSPQFLHVQLSPLAMVECETADVGFEDEERFVSRRCLFVRARFSIVPCISFETELSLMQINPVQKNNVLHTYARYCTVCCGALAGSIRKLTRKTRQPTAKITIPITIIMPPLFNLIIIV